MGKTRSMETMSVKNHSTTENSAVFQGRVVVLVTWWSESCPGSYDGI